MSGEGLADAEAWTVLLTSPWMALAAGVFGALWGSFFNVCIARIPRRLSVVRPASHCFACQTPVRPLDNVPVLSYFLLRGRCRACGARFSLRYPAVEALTGALSALVYWHFVLEGGGDDPGLGLARYFLAFAFVGVLLVLSFIDLDTKRLPDLLTLPSIPLFFLAGFVLDQAGWLDRLIGGAVGYLGVRLIADGYYYLTGREGLGLGDGKLLAVIGVLLGARALPVVVFSASLLGIVVSVPLLLWQRRRAADPAVAVPAVVQPDAPASRDEDLPVASIRRTEVPFGPFLALASVFYLLAGRALWQRFLETLGG